MKNKIIVLLISALTWHSNAKAQPDIVSASTVWSASNFALTPPSFGSWDAINEVYTLTNTVVVEHLTNKVTLTINGITVLFANGTELAVRPGEDLIVVDAILGASNTYWGGIAAVGVEDVPQFATNVPEKFEAFKTSTTYAPLQTFVRIESCSIRNAEVGVFSNVGAIVVARSSVFDNCLAGAVILDYVHPDMGTTNMENRNASYFHECTFQMHTVQNYTNAHTSFIGYKGIRLQDAFGVHVQGCTFKNTNLTDRDCGNRGVGIETDNGTVAIHASGTATLASDSCVTYTGGVGNTFTALSKGIFCHEPSTPAAHRSNNAISECSFTKCEIGIHCQELYRLLIDKCTFDMVNVDDFALNSSSCNSIYHGILIEDVEEFVVQKNTFTGEPLANFPEDVTFIAVDNGGRRNNKIFKNTFTNSDPDAMNATLFRGVHLTNDNREIDVWCNTFSECRFGIVVAAGSTIKITWLNDRGAFFRPVNNLFSGSTDRTEDLLNLSGTKINYTEKAAVWSTLVPLPDPAEWTRINGGEPLCDDFACNESKWPIGVGISELEESNVIVYPNPVDVHGSIYFETEEPQTGTIEVYDMLGRVRGSYDFAEAERVEIQNHNLSEGVYLIMIRYSSGESSSFPLLVND